MIFYHATPNRNVSSILRSGLKARSGHRGLGLTDSEFFEGGGIYLSPSIEDSLIMARETLTGRRRWAIFEVYLPLGVQTYKDLKAERCVKVANYIPPQHLRLVGYYDTKTGEMSTEPPKVYHRTSTPHSREAARRRQQGLRRNLEIFKKYGEGEEEKGA